MPSLIIMNKAYLLLGSNLGNREEWLARAANGLENLGSISKRSSVYETEPWGNAHQQHYLNQAILLLTEIDAGLLMQKLLEIEALLGRKRDEKYGPRTIDIDIIFYNSEVIKEKNLVVPHPQFHKRRFALECLHELAPGYLHPVLGKTVTELLYELDDPLEVNKIY